MSTTMSGRVLGTKSDRQPIAVDPQGRLVIAGAEGEAPNATFVMASNAAGSNPVVVTDQPAAICCISCYNMQTGGRWLFIWQGDPPGAGIGDPLWIEYLAPQDKTNVDLCGLTVEEGFSFAISSAMDQVAVVAAGDVVAFNIGYRV